MVSSDRIYWNPFIETLKGNTNNMKKCIERGLDLSICDKEGFSLMIYALHCKHSEKRVKLVNTFLRHDIACSAVDKVSGRDALTWACFLNRTREAVIIMYGTYGCLDLQLRDVYGFSALHYAVYFRSIEVIRLLGSFMKKFLLSVDITDECGVTPYMLARRIGHEESAAILSEYSALKTRPMGMMVDVSLPLLTPFRVRNIPTCSKIKKEIITSHAI